MRERRYHTGEISFLHPNIRVLKFLKRLSVHIWLPDINKSCYIIRLSNIYVATCLLSIFFRLSALLHIILEDCLLAMTCSRQKFATKVVFRLSLYAVQTLAATTPGDYETKCLKKNVSFIKFHFSTWPSLLQNWKNSVAVFILKCHFTRSCNSLFTEENIHCTDCR